MTENKILFAGPLSVGITTAIKNISDSTPATDNEHTETDYGILELETGDQIHLYGLSENKDIKPEHENCIGMILLINNADTDPIKCMLQNIEHYQELVDKEAIAVGLTNYGNSPTPDINEFHVTLREKKLNIPIFSVDVHNKHNIITLIKALLYNLDSGVN